MTAIAATEPTIVDLARECLYRFLATALSDPKSERWAGLLNNDNQDLVRNSCELLRTEVPTKSLGFGEIPAQDLDVAEMLSEIRDKGHAMADEYDRVFGLVSTRECPPYETEYHANSETFYRSQQLADIAGFYRAFGLEPSNAGRERPDHLTLEGEFMAFLLMKKRAARESAAAGADERIEICERAERDFFRDHLVWWIPSFAAGLRKKAGNGFYMALGKLLAAFMPIERAHFAVDAPRFPVQAEFIERPEEQDGCAQCTGSA